MPTSTNQAAWLLGKGQTLTVSEAPMTAPGPGEILLRTRAIALNPFDGVVQTLGSMVTPWIVYPAILGSDVAGEVVSVGSSVIRFKPGDRVLGLALGIDKIANRAAEGAFQHYVILREGAATSIPDAMSFERAVVLPLAIATAACGLFLKDQIDLDASTLEKAGRKMGAVLIWGGSTSVGGCAIQLAVAAGYDVVATASPRNFNYVGKLGAEMVFDYKDPDVVSKVVKYLGDREIAGALAVSAGSGTPCIDVVSRCKGRRIVSMASAPMPISDAPLKNQLLWKVRRLPRLAAGFMMLALRARLKGVAIRSIWGTALMNESLGQTIFRDFLGPALASGRLVPAPDPLLAGRSLRDVPAAMALLRQGVSAQKVVVSL